MTMSLLKIFARHRYESGFSLDVAFEAGAETTAVFGPSGCGKTSVLEMIAGFRVADQACISLAGHSLVDTKTGDYVAPERRCIGFVAQDLLLFPHLSVRRNLQFGQPHRLKHDLERVVRVFELETLLDRKPAQLSGGERQRVALGRAVLCGPQILLLDEPLAAIDDSLKGRIVAYLEQLLTEWRIPTLFVTHSQAEVRRLASSVVIL